MSVFFRLTPYFDPILADVQNFKKIHFWACSSFKGDFPLVEIQDQIATAYGSYFVFDTDTHLTVLWRYRCNALGKALTTLVPDQWAW